MSLSSSSSYLSSKQPFPGHDDLYYYDIARGAACFGKAVDHLPVCLRILLESLLRRHDGSTITDSHVRALLDWQPGSAQSAEIPFFVARVLLQDNTGAPLLADLAALRHAITNAGLSPGLVEPTIPVDLVVDHSVSVDYYGNSQALEKNRRLEFARNGDRYSFFKWASAAFETLRVIPPGHGILHQINLEYLAPGIHRRGELVFPDSLVGTDSHTTMINAAGIIGLGCGGIEAEAAMLGEPVYLAMPRVTGVELVGRLRPGIGATDLALSLTERLRQVDVVGQFVEFFGPGVASLAIADRATVANMAPEYGATIGFFPPDQKTLEFFLATERDPAQVQLMHDYHVLQGTFGAANNKVRYSRHVVVDLATIAPSLAGPRRPQDRVALGEMRRRFLDAFPQPPQVQPAPGTDGAGHARDPAAPGPRHGDVVLAAITSCTNTSNPAAMITAGLLARNAVQAGLSVGHRVKTSLAPGSLAVASYLRDAGLLEPLEQLGFHIAAFGCTTCIGNSGPLHPEVRRAILADRMIFSSVLSGNRNFDGRIHPDLRANYLASPALVLAYALAGTVLVDLQSEPIGRGTKGPVHLSDIWPAADEVEAMVSHVFQRPAFLPMRRELDVSGDSQEWSALPAPQGPNYDWPRSTYISRSPFFDSIGPTAPPLRDIRGARILGIFGDGFTTEHLIPAGPIDPRSPAATWLQEQGVPVEELHSYGARRGHHEVTVRGMFANPWIENRIMSILRPGSPHRNNTVLQPQGAEAGLYSVAVHYRDTGVDTVIIAGDNYGAGSSRDWAAKGIRLLGIRAIVAKSFERIHCRNLIGMGVLPICFLGNDNAATLGLRGDERIDLLDLEEGIEPRKQIRMIITRPDDSRTVHAVQLCLENAAELAYYAQGGILPAIFRKLLNRARAS
ncbi:aconitate hydratase AcnA [Candidimonas humi]|uniref:Aconitate hydratase n=1 Tax=Candidimonas humi TaxID=683355 RepID=A0ABV8NYE1_9BURK|nr:aconitate hydratase AcnA [Candidimonas humi]MBV6304654.1 aconitate hydratase AcnA [Candidimonas humi]